MVIVRPTRGHCGPYILIITQYTKKLLQMPYICCILPTEPELVAAGVKRKIKVADKYVKALKLENGRKNMQSK